MSTVQIEVDVDLEALRREANETVPRALLEPSITKLYRRGAIPGGKAAQLPGMPR